MKETREGRRRCFALSCILLLVCFQFWYDGRISMTYRKPTSFAYVESKNASRSFQPTPAPLDTSANVSNNSSGTFNISFSSGTSTELAPPGPRGNLSTEAQPLQVPFTTETKDVSIVVQLRGEMGNWLFRIGFGKYLQWRLRDEYSIRSHLVLRHQEHNSKWVRTIEDCHRCFENLRDLKFTVGNTKEFLDVKDQQNRWLGVDAPRLHLQMGSQLQTLSRAEDSLDFLASLLRTNETKFRNETEGSRNITLPFIYSDDFVMYSQISNYYDEFRAFFKLDEEACCPQIPHGDELVFHSRMFFGELRKETRSKNLRFVELSVNQTAKELLGHLKPGNKVAIISRFPKEPQVIELKRVLKQERGLQVRLVTQSSGEDFCFLAKAKYQVAGFRKSTFLLWAVVLGNATTSWVYEIDWESKRPHSNATMEHVDNLFQNPELVKRTRFVKFYPES